MNVAAVRLRFPVEPSIQSIQASGHDNGVLRKLCDHVLHFGGGGSVPRRAPHRLPLIVWGFHEAVVTNRLTRLELKAPFEEMVKMLDERLLSDVGTRKNQCWGESL